MTQDKKLKLVLAAYATAGLLAACSQHSQEISQQNPDLNRQKDLQMQELSQQKTSLDRQKDLQMQMVDNKTQELKHNVETNKKLALQNINEQRKSIEAQEQFLNAEQAKINASAEYADQNLTDQAAACKTKIKSNLETARAQVEEKATATKAQ